MTNHGGNQDCCFTPSHTAQVFKKADLVNLVHSKYIVECISYYIRPFKTASSY
jgi:hypothetical protein